MATDDSFRDLSGMTGFLKLSLGVFMAVAALGLWSGWMEISLLERAASGGFVSDAEAARNDSRQALLGGLYFLAFVATGVIFLRWTYLAVRNARSLATGEMQFTPGWAVGWYFVPVATLWKPYQAMKETFKASHPDFTDDWRDAPHPSVLSLWWMLWVIATYVGQAVLRSALRAETVDELLASSRIAVISDALDLPLVVAAMIVVTRLHSWQTEKHSRLKMASPDAPPNEEMNLSVR